jgi:competence protein ComEA
MKNLLNKTGMTKRELIIIGFLFITFTAGLLLKYSGWKTRGDFNYSRSDNAFEQQIKTAFTELEDNKTAPKLTEQKQTISEEMKKFSDSLITMKEGDTKDKKQLKPGRKININTAYAGDLELLPGVGGIMAERIIEYREQKGGFQRVDDIKKVKGIGDKKFEQIKEYIVVE